MKRLFVLFTVFVIAVFALADDKLPAHAIKVTGTSDINVSPDQATIDIGVEKQSASATGAKRAADNGAREILAVVKKNGIDDKDVKTNWLSLNPQYDWRNNRMTGFVAEQSLTVTVRDIAKLDSLLDALIKAGGNRISSVKFETSEMRKYRDQARAAAVVAAREKAEALAKSLGQSIGKAVAVEEVAQYDNSYATYIGLIANTTMEAAKDRAPSGPALAAGERKVTASVTVGFELQ